MASNWGSFPNWWVKGELLPQLDASAGRVGVHIAALKVYLLVATAVDFQTREVGISFDDLEAGTGLSRPMLKPALDSLMALGVLAVRNTRPTTYVQVENEYYRYFAQTPVDLLQSALRALPNRGASALAALKLYVALCHLRDRDGSNTARVSHERLQKLTGVRPNAVRQGVDHLVNHRLVHVQQDDDMTRIGRPANQYKILGIGDRRPVVVVPSTNSGQAPPPTVDVPF